MQRAAKNVLYTYCNTYYIAETDGDGMAMRQTDDKFPVWIFALIGLDVVALAGVGVWMFFTIRSIKKESAAQSA